jgi:hypothetical protein
VSDDPRLTCPSPLLDGAKISNVGLVFPPLPPLLDGGTWVWMCWRMSPSVRNGGGHNGHSETDEYVVRWGRKSTLGWCLSACV